MRKFFKNAAAKLPRVSMKMPSFAKKPRALKNEFRVSDLTWYLATYARSGADYTKTVTDDKGNSATYNVDYFKDGKTFAFDLTVTRDGKTYQTKLTAEKSQPHKATVTSFIFDNKPEPMRTRKETFNALNHVINQIRTMELGKSRVPEPHNPYHAPFNKMSRWMTRLTR